MSQKQFSALLKIASETVGAEKQDKINDLRKLVFELSTSTLENFIEVITSTKEINTLLAAGLTSRTNEAAMYRRKVLASLGL